MPHGMMMFIRVYLVHCIKNIDELHPKHLQGTHPWNAVLYSSPDHVHKMGQVPEHGPDFNQPRNPH